MNIKTRIFVLLALPVLVAVGACANTPPAPHLPKMGFSHLAPIIFNVGKVEISSNYKAPMKAPYVDHRFPTSPEAAALIWARDRLRASGSEGRVRFVVREASVTEIVVEKKESGLKGAFTPEPTADYVATLKASLIVDQVAGRGAEEISVQAKRNIPVNENVSLAEREQIWFEMIEALMVDFNAEMDRQTQAHLKGWLG